MNTVLKFLTDNWDRLGLGRFGDPSCLSCVVTTPQFRVSKHVIFQILSKGARHPFLVAKVPRVKHNHDALDREAANLWALQQAQAVSVDSVPYLIAYEKQAGEWILVETALVGEIMSPALVRSNPDKCAQAVFAWLLQLHVKTARHGVGSASWFERLAIRPLAHFESIFPLSTEERRLVEESRALINTLRDQQIPLVFEHGDLSSPNILFSKSGLGVLDWELAEPSGLPALDLFFFLTYLGFALWRARRTRDCLHAFHDAFFGREAWTLPYITGYAESLKLPPAAIRPLFVLCWCRYVSGLVTRLSVAGAGAKPTTAGAEVQWCRQNRFYGLWRYTIEHLKDLNLPG